MRSSIFSKKWTNKFDFTTMIPQVDLFSYVFWRKSTTPKNHFKIKWPLPWLSIFNPTKDLEPTLYMENTFLFPSSKQPYRQTLRNAAMNIKIQVGNFHIFPTRQEVVDKTLGGVHKLCWQDFAHNWPPTHPLLTFMEELLY